MFKIFKGKNKDIENDDDVFVSEFDLMEKQEEYEEELSKKYNFNISATKAVEIYDRNENLKSDYYRTRRGISYLNFETRKINLVEIKKKKYWMIQVLNGDVSGMKIDLKGGTSIFWDGILAGDELKKLRCLIDVDTGEYIYYPHAKFFDNSIFRRRIIE